MPAKWPSSENPPEKISETTTTVKTLDPKTFTAPAVGLKRKRKGKVSRHFKRSTAENMGVQQSTLNFDAFDDN